MRVGLVAYTSSNPPLMVPALLLHWLQRYGRLRKWRPAMDPLKQDPEALEAPTLQKSEQLLALSFIVPNGVTIYDFSGPVVV